MARALCIHPDYPADRQALAAMFRNPSLQMVSFTITEKGYALKDLHGNLMPEVAAELEAGPESC